MQCVFCFSLRIYLTFFHLGENLARYYHKRSLNLHYNTQYLCSILHKLEFSCTDFNRSLRYKIPRMSFRWEASCSMLTDVKTDTQTAGYYEADCLFPQFANAQNRRESFPMFKAAIFKNYLFRIDYT